VDGTAAKGTKRRVAAGGHPRGNERARVYVCARARVRTTLLVSGQPKAAAWAGSSTVTPDLRSSRYVTTLTRYSL
jgi:hypothetical protein